MNTKSILRRITTSLGAVVIFALGFTIVPAPAFAVTSKIFLSPPASLRPSPSPSPTSSPVPTVQPTVVPVAVTPPRAPVDDIATAVARVRIANAILTKLGNSPKALSIAQERQVVMKSLAKKDPKSFLGVTLGGTARARLAPDAQKYVEKQGTIQGRLEVLHIDDFKNGENSRFEYTLNSSGTRYALLSPATIAERYTGTVKVTGFSIDNVIVLNAGDPSIVPISAGQDPQAAVGDQRVLALITEMTDNKSTVSIDDVKKGLFDPASSFQVYYKTQSYGKVGFVGSVYKISLNRKPTADSCGSGVYIQDDDVVAAIKSQNIDLANFDRVLFIPPIGYCSGVGKMQIQIGTKIYSLSESWVDWYSFGYAASSKQLNTTLAHELGHALGVMHANSLICGSGTTCLHQEYGNSFDVMGTGVGDFNALYKEQLNWLLPKDFLNITSAGTYSMKSLESTDGYRAAKVINPSLGARSVMYLERRMNASSTWATSPIFSQRNGLLLNIPQQSMHITTTAPELIDMTPSSDNSNVALKAGSADFTPQSSGVTFGGVKLDSKAAENINFNVDMKNVPCTGRTPTVTAQTWIPKVTTGQESFTSIGGNVTNNDPGCAAASDFALTFDALPSGWVPVITITAPGDSDGSRATGILPGDIAYLYSSIKIPSNAAVGVYPIKFTIKNISSGLSASDQGRIEIKPQPVISLNVKKAAPGDVIQLTTNVKDENEWINVSSGVGPSGIILYSGYATASGIMYVPIPRAVNRYGISCTNGDDCHTVVSGDYSFALQAWGGTSNYVPLLIDGGDLPVPPVLTMPDERDSLTLGYDERNHESSLNLKRTLTIVAGTSDLGLYPNYGYVTFKNFDTKAIPQQNMYGSLTVTPIAPTSVKSITDDYGREVLQVAKGSTGKFSITSTVYPQQMPPGSYTASISSLDFMGPDAAVPPNESSFITIVGETAPYITGSNVVDSICKTVTIQGVRFHPTDNTINLWGIDNNGKTYQAIKHILGQKNSTILNFIPAYLGIKAGTYYINVVNANLGDAAGTSNSAELVIKDTFPMVCPRLTTTPSPTPNIDPVPTSTTVNAPASASSASSQGSGGQAQQAAATVTTTSTPTPTSTVTTAPSSTVTASPSSTVSASPSPTSSTNASPTSTASPTSSPHASAGFPSNTSFLGSVIDAILGLFR